MVKVLLGTRLLDLLIAVLLLTIKDIRNNIVTENVSIDILLWLSLITLLVILIRQVVVFNQFLKLNDIDTI